MITICPKCCVVRPAQAQSPNWQCPSCGLAYAKASGGSAAWGLAEVSPSDRGGVGSGESEIDNVPWFKLSAVLAIAYGAWLGYQRLATGGANNGAGVSSTSHVERIGSNPCTERLTQLVASAAARATIGVRLHSNHFSKGCENAVSGTFTNKIIHQFNIYGRQQLLKS